MDIYQLHQFIDKQNEELASLLKKEGLTPSITTFTPTWKNSEKEKKSEPKYYHVSQMTRLRLTIEFTK